MTQAETVASQGGEKVDGSRKKQIDEVVFLPWDCSQDQERGW